MNRAAMQKAQCAHGEPGAAGSVDEGVCTPESSPDWWHGGSGCSPATSMWAEETSGKSATHATARRARQATIRLVQRFMGSHSRP